MQKIRKILKLSQLKYICAIKNVVELKKNIRTENENIRTPQKNTYRFRPGFGRVRPQTQVLELEQVARVQAYH